MTIPVDAVYYENGEPYVYTYSDGKVWQKFIEEGIFDSDILEVKSGLSMDDMVVTTWSSELYDGAEVRLKGKRHRMTAPVMQPEHLQVDQKGMHQADRELP